MLTDKPEKLLIKNMVCRRCILTVENILQTNNLPFSKVLMGEAALSRPLSKQEFVNLEKDLQQVGFELIETRINGLVEKIKILVLEYLNNLQDVSQQKLSVYITDNVHHEYSYLSNLFSSIEGFTIEQYFLIQRIEKVKELLVYDQLSLTEISYQTGFSSVHHLSTQFKKITGLTPSFFKKIGMEKRRSIDQL